MKKQSIHIFVDGSAKNKDTAGYGMLVMGHDFKQVLHTEAELVRHPDYQNNAAAEIVGAIQALTYALANDYKTVHIYYDFIGVKEYAYHHTNARSELNEQYFYLVRKCIKKDMELNYTKITAHTGNIYNEVADRLAWLGRKKSTNNFKDMAPFIKHPTTVEELSHFLTFTYNLKRIFG